MRALLLALLAFASPAVAHEPGGLIAPLASRLFLIGDPPTPNPLIAPGGPATLDLTGVPWIGALLADDPALAGAQVVLAASAESSSMAILSDKGLPIAFDQPAPPGLARPGLAARVGSAGPGSVLYVPEAPPRDLMVRCHLSAPGEEICEMMTTYAADALILPTAAWMGPLPRDLAQMRAMADRMREVAGCLDVTQRPPADPAARLRDLLATNPRLEDCTEALLS